MFTYSVWILSIVLQLFERNPADRLGMPTCPSGPINSQPFYRNIDWEKLEARQIPPPFKPKIVSLIFFVVVACGGVWQLLSMLLNDGLESSSDFLVQAIRRILLAQFDFRLPLSGWVLLNNSIRMINISCYQSFTINALLMRWPIKQFLWLCKKQTTMHVDVFILLWNH